MSSRQKVIVFGSTGFIGTNLIEILSKEQPDWQILAVSRSEVSSSSRLKQLNLPNVQFVQGDVEDLDRVKELTLDTQTVYCTVGFKQYERQYWSEHWPVVVDNLLAVTNEQRPLVFCDNLYAYAPTTNISPSSPTIEPSLHSKPAIRALIRQKFEARMKSHPKSIIVVGDADFFGPHVTSTSFLGDVFFGNMVLHHKKPLVISSGNHIHDFCYAPDFTKALYLASVNKDAALGKFWVCPHAVKNKTLRDIAADASDLLVSDKKKKIQGVTAMPAFAVKLLSLFDSFMREMKEMLPFWTNDYSVDDSDFVKTFGVEATPYDRALKETIAFFETQ